MRLSNTKLVLTLSLAAICCGVLAANPDSTKTAPSARFERVAKRMAEAINRQDFQAVQQDFAQVMLDALPLEKAKPFFENLLTQYGKIKRLDLPRLVPPNQAVFPAQFEWGVLDITLVLDEFDKIIGLWFRPHVPEIPVPERHETELELPFRGRWLVFWGGDTKQQNQHYDVPNQKFAFDFLGVDAKGETRTGDGTANENYFAFGRQILAPADGVVTDVIDGVRDNLPGSMNPYSALGNAVFIRHRPREVSVLAHLKLASIKVKAGQQVKKGQLIGLCGNSGNSSEPHLHYHLQNTPIIQDASAIRCTFGNVTVQRNAESIAKPSYSPIKGDIIAPSK